MNYAFLSQRDANDQKERTHLTRQSRLCAFYDYVSKHFKGKRQISLTVPPEFSSYNEFLTILCNRSVRIRERHY